MKRQIEEFPPDPIVINDGEKPIRWGMRHALATLLRQIAERLEPPRRNRISASRLAKIEQGIQGIYDPRPIATAGATVTYIPSGCITARSGFFDGRNDG